MNDDYKDLQEHCDWMASRSWSDQDAPPYVLRLKSLLADYDALRAERDGLKSTIDLHNAELEAKCKVSRELHSCQTRNTSYMCSMCPRHHPVEISVVVDAAIQTEAGDAGPPKQEQE